MFPARRQALTLIETVAVVAIVGVLSSILLAAVSSARSAAARITCQSRLKSLGLAIANYIDAFGRYPIDRGTAMSFLSRTLPYLDASSVSDAINFSASKFGGGGENETVARRNVAAFLCPTFVASQVASAGRGIPGITTPGPKAAPTCYLGNYGVGGHLLENGQTRPIRQGLLGHNLSPADVLDGLSHTALLSEIVPSANAGGREREPNRYSYSVGSASTDDEFDDQCNAASIPSATLGMAWILPRLQATLYTHWSGPNRRSCLGAVGNPGLVKWFAVSATSSHLGGVYVALADGSVIWTSDAIDRNIWRALSTRDGADDASL